MARNPVDATQTSNFDTSVRLQELRKKYGPAMDNEIIRLWNEIRASEQDMGGLVSDFKYKQTGKTQWERAQDAFLSLANGPGLRAAYSRMATGNHLLTFP